MYVESGYVSHMRSKISMAQQLTEKSPFSYEKATLRVADALLSDWEGDHWASLDADQDKLALSWTKTEEDITFQVRFLCYIS